MVTTSRAKSSCRDCKGCIMLRVGELQQIAIRILIFELPHKKHEVQSEMWILDQHFLHNRRKTQRTLKIQDDSRTFQVNLTADY
jgi:hypothetical protein